MGDNVDVAMRALDSFLALVEEADRQHWSQSRKARELDAKVGVLYEAAGALHREYDERRRKP